MTDNLKKKKYAEGLKKVNIIGELAQRHVTLENTISPDATERAHAR